MGFSRKRSLFSFFVFIVLMNVNFVTGTVLAHVPHVCPEGFPDSPAMLGHLEQNDIVSGEVTFKNLVHFGSQLFSVRFNKCDGQGRPAATGTGEKRESGDPSFIRTSSPEANSCAGCHNQPQAGGGGDFVANVFVLAQAMDPVTYSVSSEFSNERNTLGMHGAGPIEMLAREMSADLQRQAANLSDGTHVVTTKGVSFEITISGGLVVESKGVDSDLIIKPFHQAGVVRSIREFTVNALNHHHGIQAEERFDLNQAKGLDTDFDEDGITREMTLGDVTALTIFQAALGTPTQVLPSNSKSIGNIRLGKRLFQQTGCSSCHVPKMTLDSRYFVEPNPLNPQGTFNDAESSFAFDMTEDGEAPRLEKSRNRKAIVRAYTDLKRHNLCDNDIRYYCNEQMAQGRPDQDGKPGQEFFITRKLWDVGSSAPYGHRGDLTTIAEAILVHGGEARQSRDAFAALTTEEQAAMVKFLKTLQVRASESYRDAYRTRKKIKDWMHERNQDELNDRISKFLNWFGEKN